MKASWFDPGCRDCPRLARYLAGIRRTRRDYHAAPVPPFGDAKSRLLIVGLAPGMHGANRTGRPFTGDHAGLLLYRTLHDLGLSNRPEASHLGDGLKLRHCRITNAVKCVPPENKPTADEINNCNRYLRAEIESLPERAVLLALGGIAHRAILKALSLPQSRYAFAHGRVHPLPSGQRLVDSYHCSRYNTQTGRLTPRMFTRALKRARDLALADA